MREGLILRLAGPMLALATAAAAAQQPPAAAPVGEEMSPGVAWNPHGPDTRAPGLRRLTPSELALAQRRAGQVYELVQATPSFRRTPGHATLFAATAAIEPPGVLQLDLIPTWSSPRDVRRRVDGVLAPVLGGGHVMIWLRTNVVPRADQLLDRATAGDYSRGVSEGRHGGSFAMPRVLGELGGGTVYAQMIVFTRDGRSVLVPTPIGTLLDGEIARLQQEVATAERASAERVRQAEASMTPQAVGERRARREAAWQRETRDPAQLARRLDAAHATDEADLQRTRREFSIPPQPDPRHRYWAPKLALDAAQALAATLDAAGRQQPACARSEPGFAPGHAVRFDVAGRAAGCVPMVQVRDDLLDPRRPTSDVQLLTVWFSGELCGEYGAADARPLPAGGRCGFGVRLLRELDWAAARRALDW